MNQNMKLPAELDNLLNHPSLRRARLGDDWLYSVQDLLVLLPTQNETTAPSRNFASSSLRGYLPEVANSVEEVLRNEPNLSRQIKWVKMLSSSRGFETVDMLPLEGVFHLLQLIESPITARLRQWLAAAGRERIEEVNDPELAIRRTRAVLENRGYSRQWIEKRLRGMWARHELTGQWARRGAQDDDYRKLTNELMANAFGMDVETYKRYKGLGPENLRDHMNDLELALTVLGETTAAILHRERDSHGPADLQRDVTDAGEIARRTREDLEARLGRPVATPEHYALRKRRKAG
jgi:DNA-damage-inducible protein D